MKKNWIGMLAFLILAFGRVYIASSGLDRHFVGVTPTPFMVDFMGELLINNVGAEMGDEIGVFTAQGVLCGAMVIKKTGQYGILHVYGDDPTTPEIEGASPGSQLTFVIWESESDIEYSVSVDEMATFSAGSFRSSPIPPVWTGDREKYGLNIRLNVKSVE